MLSLNRRNPSIVQVRLPASRRDFSFPFRRFPDFPSKARARGEKERENKMMQKIVTSGNCLQFPESPAKIRENFTEKSTISVAANF